MWIRLLNRCFFASLYEIEAFIKRYEVWKRK